MRLQKTLIFTLIILHLVGCKHSYTQNETILRAEQLLIASPDSAYNLLKTIKNPEKLSDADYAAWCLHFTHAQYKLYLDIKSDSLIRKALDYHDNTSMYLYSGTSNYLLGCILELNNDKKSALFYYKKANDILSPSNEYLIKGIVNHKIGFMLLSDEYYSEAELYLQNAIHNYKKSGNNNYLNNCYKNLAELKLRSGASLTDILKIIDESKTISLKEKDSAFYYNMLFFEATVLIDSNLLRSKKLLLTSFSKLPYYRTNVSAFLTYAYSKLNMVDSAKYYANFTKVKTNDENIESLIELSNAYLAHCQGNSKQAFISFENAYKSREESYKENIKEQLIRIDKQYDLSKKEAEKAKLEIQNQKNIILIAFLSITVLAILLILLIITNINRKRQAEMTIEKQQLEFNVKTKQVENEKKIKLLHANLQNKIDNTLRFKRIQTNLSNTDKKEDFLTEITRQSVLTDKEWHFYIDQANELFGGNIAKLRSEYPQLTDADTIIIALICLGIDISNSMVLLDYSSTNTMYIRRNRIKKHLGLENPTDLEKWLRNYLHKNSNSSLQESISDV